MNSPNQSSTPKSQPQTQANQSQSQSNPPKATSTSPTPGTQPSQATPSQSNSQPAKTASQQQSSASATNVTSSVTGQASGTPVSSGSTKQVTLDIENKLSTTEVDYAKNGKYPTYTAKSGCGFNKIVKKTEVIWESKDVCGTIVATKGNDNVAIFLETGGCIVLKKSSGKWNDISSQKHDITRLKFYGENDNEITSSNYKVKVLGYSSSFAFIYEFSEVKCLKIKFGDNDLWKHTDDDEYKDITMFQFDPIKNELYVAKNKNKYKKIDYKGPLAPPASQPGATTAGTTQAQPKGATTTPQAQAPATPAVEAPKVAPSSRPVTLNISGKASTEDYDFTTDHNRNIKIYTAKGSSMFNKVVKDDTVIWTTNDSTKYVTKVFTDGIGACASTKNVTIYLFNGHIEHYWKSDGGWQKASNKICLDLGKTSSTIGFDFHHDGEKRTFTAKPGYLFNSVILSGCMSGNTFWQGGTDERCSRKVVVYGVESSIKNVNVFLENERVIHAHKVGRNWISSTGFTLDIGKNSNNDLFDYRSTRGFGHFNPKANLSITNIVKKELKIWSAKDRDYGLKVVLMGSGKDVKHMSILLESGKFVLLTKSGQNKPWQDVTQNKHNFSGVRMFSLDEGTSKYHQLTKEDYEPIVFECRYGYEFKNDVRCVMITNMDMVLWSHTEDTEFGYPKGFYLDLRQNKFSVTSLKDQTKEVTPTKISAAISVATPVVKVPVAEPVKAPVAKEAIVTPKATLVAGPPIVKLYSSKPGELTCKVEKEFDDFDYYLQDLKCELITHDGNCVWKHETGKPYPRYMSYNEEDCKIVVSFEKEYYTCTIQDSKWKSVIRSQDGMTGGIGPSYAFGDTSTLTKSYSIISTGDTTKPTEAKTVAAPAVTAPPTPTEPTKVALDIEKKQTTTEYDYKDENGVVTYSPRDNRVFNKVNEGDYEIWKSAADVFGKLVRTKETKGVNYLVVLLNNRTFSLFQEGENEWKDITKERHDVTKLKFYGEGDTVLKETDYDVTIVDMSFSHTFKTGVKCKKVTLGQVVVWKSGDDPKFPTIAAFSLGLASNCFFIKNPSGEVKKIEPKPVVKEEAVTKVTAAPVAKGEPTPITTVSKSINLDIKATEGTNQFDFNEDNNVKTFSGKDDCVFDKVSEGNTLVWDCKDGVSGTMVRSKKFTNGDIFLVILLEDDMFQLFQKLAGKKWSDVTADRFDLKKLKFFGESDTELKSSDYKVNLAFLSYEFIFNTGVKCKTVKLGDDVVWKHSEDPKFEEIKAFTLGLTTNKFFVKNKNDEVKKIEYEAKTKEEVKGTVKAEEPKPVAEPAKPVDKEPAKEVTETIKPATAQVTTAVTTQPTTTSVVKEAPKPAVPEEPLSDRTEKSIDLDIDKTQGTDKIEYSKSQSGNIHSFTPKGDHLFIKITQGNDVLWESRSNLFGTKVIFISEGNKNYVGIILDNGGLVLFNKFAGKWDDITNTKYDVMKLKFYDDKEKELTSSSYEVALVDYSYRIIFNRNVKCKKVKYGNDDVWKSTDDTKFKEIKMFDLDFVSNSFVAVKDKNKSKKLDFKPTPTTTTPPATQTPTTTAATTTTTTSPVTTTTPPATTTATTPVTTGTTKGVTLDIATTQSTNDCDYCKSGSYPTYTAKSGCGFNKIVKKTEVIWESKNVLGTIVATKGNDNVAIFLDSGGCLVLKKSSGKWNDISSQKHDISKVKLFGDNDVEIKRADYKVKVLGYSSSFAFIYELNQGVKCKKVKLGSKEIWKQSDHPDYDVTMFQFDPIKNELYVAKTKDSYKKLSV
ncbi:hypothetical protein TpMuguga_02g00802 [Theileria parva strain Muguga]|uniref:Uncharacterized protein n=1 Tax=Theileria parva TaxID=5875 RepID=Q4N437_THEPA|nr:uncharacterized protein TpMuguga_02g00802 [Theileria parva strain Muguga]EAN33086.1 hypothetical protein TpMuguga_02g00802 [Theileria parva strain Muguga]|eukprot:XP_765369.1 hypothetical protein [Theileria parva strain Muguga]